MEEKRKTQIQQLFFSQHLFSLQKQSNKNFKKQTPQKTQSKPSAGLLLKQKFCTNMVDQSLWY